MSQPTLTIRPAGDKITVEFDRDSLSEEALGRYLGLIDSAFIAQTSQLSEADADLVAEEMKAGWWAREGSSIKEQIQKSR